MRRQRQRWGAASEAARRRQRVRPRGRSSSQGQQPKKKQRSGQCNWRRSRKQEQGPTSYEEIYNFGERLVESFMAQTQAKWSRASDSDEPEFMNMLRDSIIYVTSSYSGIGSAEWSCNFLRRAIRSKLGIDVQFVVYSACDSDNECRKVLLAHRDPAQHIFTDLLDRVDRGGQG